MKTKLLRKIRKVFLMKYIFDEYKLNKELVLLDIKNGKIIKKQLHIVPDLAFVLEKLKKPKLLKKYWGKRAIKTFKRL